MECGDNESQPVLRLLARHLTRFSHPLDAYRVNIPKTNRVCLEKLLASISRLSYIIINQFSVLCADSTAQRFALNLFLLLVDSFSTSPSRNLLRLGYSIKSKNYLRDSFRLSLSARVGFTSLVFFSRML